jgi:hypothetical protein
MPVRPCTSGRAGIDDFLAFFFFLRFLFFVRFFIRCIRANPRSISYPLFQKRNPLFISCTRVNPRSISSASFVLS